MKNIEKHFLDSEWLEAFYLEYFNDYLTVSKIAEHYGMLEAQAQALINQGREINNRAKL